MRLSKLIMGLIFIKGHLSWCCFRKICVSLIFILLSFLPSLPHTRFLFTLIIFQPFFQKLFMVLTFFYNFINVLFFIFTRFLKLLSNMTLFLISPFHELFLNCINFCLFFHLFLQFLTKLSLSFLIIGRILSARIYICSRRIGSSGWPIRRLFDLSFNIILITFAIII